MENHNRDLDPGFEEDPEIFIELKEGVFHQTSYEGTEVAIIADYPGLLPSSHVSTQETPSQREFSPCDSPAALYHAPKGRRSSHHVVAKASSREMTLAHGTSLKRKANDDTAGPSPSSKRYNSLTHTQWIDRMVTFPAVPYRRRSVRRTVSGDLASHAQTNPAPNPATRTGGDMEAMSDCHIPEDSDNVSVTNSEVESSMNHRAGGKLRMILVLLKRHSMPSAQRMLTSELLGMDLLEPLASLQRICG